MGKLSVSMNINWDMDMNETIRIFKEMKVGFTNGLILGTTSFLFIGLYVMIFKHYSASFAFCISGCVGVSLLLSMVIASLVGTTVPIFFKKINIDPAVASGPLITTVNDLAAVVSYYGIAWLLLIKILALA